MLRVRTPRAATPLASAWWRCCVWTRHQSTTPTAVTQTSSSASVSPGRTARWKEEARQFAQLPAALQAFHASVGHRIVPYHLPIPSTSSSHVVKKPGVSQSSHGSVVGLVHSAHEIEWPSEVRGRLNLGRVLHKFMTNAYYHTRHPRVKEQLEEIGFPVNADWQQYVWQHQRMAAIQTFYDLYGHSVVTRSFVVPRGDPQWPVQTWGYRLGVVVDRLRHEREELTTSQLQDLERVQFTFSVYDTEWSERILPSLETFAQVYGHCLVSQAFVVPHHEPWPERAYGLKLGHVVSGMRHDNGFTDQAERDAKRLEAINFVWDFSEHQWSTVIVPAFETYRLVYGHCKISVAFVVPSEEPWPTEAWGLRLGRVVSGMRYKGYYSDQVSRDAERLKWLALILDPVECEWTQQVLPALEIYHDVYGSEAVPRKFVVPAEDPWPRETYGVRLGAAVEKIRSRGAFAEQIARDVSRIEVLRTMLAVQVDGHVVERAA